jgi:tetratricopeptide (TPR) repeat protein
VVVVAAAVIFESRNAPVSETASVTGGGTGDERVSAAVLEEISSLEKTVTADPSNSAALLSLANRLHDAKFYPRAIETYKRYISLEPKEPDPRVDLGICYYEMGDSKTAVKEIESALAIDPKHQMAMFNLGVIYLSSNDVPKAKEWFRRCSELDSTTVAGKRAKELLSNH